MADRLPVPRYLLSILLACYCLQPLLAQVPAYDGARQRRPLSPADSTAINLLISRGTAMVNEHTDSAMILLNMAETQSRSLGYSDGIALALMGRSSCFAVRNETVTADQLLDKAYPYCIHSQQKDKLLVKWYRTRFISYKYSGRTDSAMATVSKVIPIVERLQDSVYIINSYNHIGSILIDNRDYKNAYTYIRKALLLNTPLNSDKLVSYLNLGYIYAQRSDLDSMYRVALLAYEGARKLQTPRYERSACLLLNKYFLDKGQDRKADEYARRAIALIDGNAADNRLYVYRVLCMNYKNYKKYTQALAYGNQALAYLQPRPALRADINHLYLLLAEVYHASGNQGKAYDMLMKYNQLSDSLNVQEHDKTTGYLEKQFRLAEKEKEIALKENQLLVATGKVKNRNIWIAIVSVSILVVAGIFTGLYRSSRRKIHMLRQQREIESLRAMMEGEERERNRIAIELHDNIGGMLSVAAYSLESLKDGHYSPSEQELFRKVDDIIGSVRKEVRRTAHTLMPDVLLRHSLPEAIRQYCQFIEADTGLIIDIQQQGNFEQLDQHIQLALYRIAQELIQNILKHAGAGHVMVQVHLGKDLVSLTVEDDGVGFNRDGPTTGRGLQHIERRLLAINGKIAIDSEAGKGSSIYIEIGAS
ncbi:tetratricopeptide repeat-containing sensor histidine kinase [Taibaiella chishuiensis]|uniref:tetratricopeptide repeat-containing sensor histidine kinase n=1 Tax=Taibaiella chishuiensis TaxID=1434707 RepID=UPI0011B29608|nr:sensor histidine kinase [Taibaiella chishuiensis]